MEVTLPLTACKLGCYQITAFLLLFIFAVMTSILIYRLNNTIHLGLQFSKIIVYWKCLNQTIPMYQQSIGHTQLRLAKVAWYMDVLEFSAGAVARRVLPQFFLHS